MGWFLIFFFSFTNWCAAPSLNQIDPSHSIIFYVSPILTVILFMFMDDVYR